MVPSRKTERIIAAGAIIYRPSKGFLLLRNRDYWEFPKGRVDSQDGQELRATALREITEETALSDVKLLDGFHEVERYAVSSGPKEVNLFLGITSQEPIVSSEHRGYCWCHPSEVLSFLSYESKRMIFRKALELLRARGLLKNDDELIRGKSLRPQQARPLQAPSSTALKQGVTLSRGSVHRNKR